MADSLSTTNCRALVAIEGGCNTWRVADMSALDGLDLPGALLLLKQQGEAGLRRALRGEGPFAIASGDVDPDIVVEVLQRSIADAVEAERVLTEIVEEERVLVRQLLKRKPKVKKAT